MVVVELVGEADSSSHAAAFLAFLAAFPAFLASFPAFQAYLLQAFQQA